MGFYVVASGNMEVELCDGDMHCLAHCFGYFLFGIDIGSHEGINTQLSKYMSSV